MKNDINFGPSDLKELNSDPIFLYEWNRRNFFGFFSGRFRECTSSHFRFQFRFDKIQDELL